MYKILIQDTKSKVVIRSNYSNIDKCLYPEDSEIVKTLCFFFCSFDSRKTGKIQKKVKDVDYIVELLT